eukprot:6481289-Amphidinium_carterae.1
MGRRATLSAFVSVVIPCFSQELPHDTMSLHYHPLPHRHPQHSPQHQTTCLPARRSEDLADSCADFCELFPDDDLCGHPVGETACRDVPGNAHQSLHCHEPGRHPLAGETDARDALALDGSDLGRHPTAGEASARDGCDLGRHPLAGKTCARDGGDLGRHPSAGETCARDGLDLGRHPLAGETAAREGFDLGRHPPRWGDRRPS